MRHSLLVLFSFPCLAPAMDDTAKKAERTAEGARVVVAAVRTAAEVDARLPRRTSGDELTQLYVRAAAAAAHALPADQAVSGFLVGLGIALDDSELLRANPLTAALCRRVESDPERRQRLAVLGKPTLRQRRDLCQHFAVSCTLTELLGESLAEGLGLAKEQKDMQGGTGFSFHDMTANLSGIRLAHQLRRGQLDLATLAKGFRVADYLPELQGLREGLRRKDFEELYGSVTDPRFLKEMAGIRERVRKLDDRR